ncbi:ATPase subunit of ABC transporter with duplicated ATPase domains [Paenibacillus taihuensis]|uniref:ATPase subunit of ABC transporter with duplicated ATPase domains n=1 Tax=Paenibacillus taihuensis TaxID=1156355 RepID=A0A3D9Q3I0_9BACL|nr:ABC-F type ribosomal protection protein [Paenibacillus taihuensis]REE55464.1 ATPase subunit of ABC transporter with duplicated ATPase domains [Paenibacillus taihuensis]
MIIINGQHIKKYYGANLVLEDVTFEIQEKERIGLVGRNGSGKSTLISLIARLSKPDEGLLTIRKELRIGYLAQIPAHWDDGTVYDVLASSCKELLECKEKMTQLEQQMSDPDTASDSKRLERLLADYAKLQERFQTEGGYELDARIDTVANGLQIPKAMYERSYASLSGGEKTKIGLAALLISGPELLLLDEPTNHLDLQSVAWLESYLNSYDGACLVVSHDRAFLDNVVSKIIDLEDGEATSYHGNYSRYVKEKEERLLQQFAQYQEQQKQIKKMKDSIKQLTEWGRNSGNEKFFKRAFSMQKALDRMEKVKRPVLDPKSAEFQLKPEDRSGKRVVTLSGVSKRYGSKVLLNEADGMLLYGDKIMLLGRNGTGKTTLFKMIIGDEAADDGAIEVGARVEIGYLAQQEYPADDKKSVLAYFREQAAMEEGEARSHLARYLFYGASVFKGVSQLSGGEWTRLRLALLILKKPNLLLLDEPTNHMDIAAREALEEALEEFPGTILAISHDRYFINKLASHIWELRSGQIHVFTGNYENYAEKREELLDREASTQASVQQHKEPAAAATAATAAHSAKQTLQNKQGKAGRVDEEKLEAHIEQAEKQLAMLDAELLEGASQTQGDTAELTRRWMQREELQQQLNELYENWAAK